MKTALITGATSGIGKATAQALAPNHRLILCGRNTANLAAIQAELSKVTEVTTLTFDVSDKKGTFDAIASLPTQWQSIDVLVNNAGNAHGLATFQEANMDDLEAMININVMGIIYVTKAVLPLMMGKDSGHIVNLSSIAGKEAYQYGTTYCASKAAVEAFSKGLRYDLLSEGIKVTNVAPGAVETDFSLIRFKGDSDKASNVYKGYTPLVAEDIASAIAYIINSPEHMQVADITVFPKAQAGATTIRKKM